MSATPVASRPTFTEYQSASRAPLLSIARSNHLSVYPGGGHSNVRASLNA
jgi:hypothetical protein